MKEAKSIWSLHIYGPSPSGYDHDHRFNGFFYPFPCIKMLLRQFSNINAYIRIIGIMPKQQFNAMIFFSNSGEKVLIFVERGGQICPYFHLFYCVPWIKKY